MKQIKRRNCKLASVYTFFIVFLFSITLINTKSNITVKSDSDVVNQSSNYEQSQNSVSIEIEIDSPESACTATDIDLVGTPIKSNDEDIIQIDEDININIDIDKSEYLLPYNPNYIGFKTYMDYRAITSVSSKQWQLQQIAYSDEKGIRKVNDRYCVAIGTYFNGTVGQYFDLVLENGTVIPCIIGDIKADIHTDSSNIYTMFSNCCSEFIIDIYSLSQVPKRTGNMSNTYNEWNSPVQKIIIYNTNVLD